MATKKLLGLFKSGWSVRGIASGSGYSRTTVAYPPIEGNYVEYPNNRGIDYKHWLVSVEEPKGTREEIAEGYVKTLAAVIGDDQVARKKIYSVSTRGYFAFGALISKEEAMKLKKVPNVLKVLADCYEDWNAMDYGGEPFIDGQLVPYDPKYHKNYDDFQAFKRAREEEEARALEEMSETDTEDDEDTYDLFK